MTKKVELYLKIVQVTVAFCLVVLKQCELYGLPFPCNVNWQLVVGRVDKIIITTTIIARYPQLGMAMNIR